MISHIFSKTKPVNFIIVSLLLAFYIISFEGFVGVGAYETTSVFSYFSKNIGFFIKGMGVLLPTLFLMDFVLKRNKIVLTHSYQLLYFVVFTGVFTAIYTDINLLLAHFFILLGLRRLLSLNNKQNTNRKIFEASLWFFVASYFYDWAILFFVVLLGGMVLFEKTSIRHWGLVLWSLVIYSVLVAAFVSGTNSIEFYNNHYFFSYSGTAFINKLPLRVVFFLLASIAILLWMATKGKIVKNASLGRKNHLRLLFLSGIVGLVLYILHPSQTDTFEGLIFVFFPLSFLLGQATAELKKGWHKNLALWISLSIPLWGLLAYLLQN